MPTRPLDRRRCRSCSPTLPACDGRSAPSSACRSRSPARASACCASTTASRTRGPTTTSRSLQRAGRRRSPPSSNAARSPRSSSPARSGSTSGSRPPTSAASTGTWSPNALHWDDRLMELFGYASESLRAAHRLVLGRACTRTTARATEAAIARAVEALRRLRGRLPRRAPRRRGALGRGARARAVRPATGGPRGCSARPTTRPTVHSAAERLGRVLETMSTAFFTLDRGWTLHLRQRRRRADPRPPPRRAGRPTSSGRLYPGPRRAPRPSSGYRARAGDAASRVSFEQYYPPLDTWFDVRATPSEDGLSVYFHDITDRVRAEQRARGGAGSRPARRPGACRSSARRARGWRARWRSTSCCGSSSDVVLNGFGEGLVVGARRRTSLARVRAAPSSSDRVRASHARRVAGAAATRARRTSRSTVDRFGVPHARSAGELLPALADDRSARPAGADAAARLARADAGRDGRARRRSRARSTGACWSSSPRAPASRSTTRCCSAPSGGSR